MINTIEIEFKYSSVLYTATAELLPHKKGMIRVYGFYPNLPAFQKEVYFFYNPEKKKMDFPTLPRKQKEIVESILASVCESCKDSANLFEMII